MFRHARIFTMLAVVMLALVFSAGSAGRVSAQSQGCDITGTRNGTATPTYGTTGSTLIFRGTGFAQGEDVSFWFTTPQQEVFGTANPVSGGVAPDGSVALRLTIPREFVDFAPGKWAITFQGATSNNVAVIYFCVLTPEQATQVAQPATATAVPPTAVPPTAVPPTAVPPTTVPTTAVPATATTVATTAPAVSPTTDAAMSPTAAAVSPTAVATDAGAAATATTAPALPTDTVMPMESPTSAAIPTEVLPVATPDTGTGAGAGDLPGMPTAGQSDGSMLVTLVLAALGLMGAGLLARRAKSVSR
ncbi:MAG: hypothetical protein M3441_12905 [Chloroflexota bacterium]|nr:hypothetical protein [Chloroflexota bacterium]